MTTIVITLRIVGRMFNTKLTDPALKVIELIKHFPHPIRLPPRFSRLSMIVSTTLALSTQSLNAQEGITKTAKNTLDLDPVIAFYGAYPELKSQTFARGGDWRYWTKRGAVASRGVVHQTFLRQNVAEASDYLARLDLGDNPNPVIDIDELGWDFDGGIDRHSMAILKATHEKRPNLKIAVWQMRGPIATLSSWL